MNKYDYLWNNPQFIIPNKGDFSFIPNKKIGTLLLYDYNIFTEYGLWDLLINKDYDLFKKAITFCHKNHSQQSFINNIHFLTFIYVHGWTEFVIRVLNERF